MAISFNEIGTDLRTPFCFVEFDASKAQQGPSTMQYRILLMAQRLATGTVPALTPTRITSAKQGEKAFGKGSQAARMLAAHFRNNTTTELVVVALEDDSAGQKASGTMTFTGSASLGGTLCLYIAGERVRVGINTSMDAAAMATAVAAAVAAEGGLPVTATAFEGVVTFTAKHAGEWGNDIDVRLNYYTGEETPEGVQIAFAGADHGLDANMVDGSPSLPCEVAAMRAGVAAYYAAIDPARPLQTLPLTGYLPPKEGQGMKLKNGSGNPEIENVFAVMDDKHYHIFTLPYTDAANLMAIKEELARRWGPLKMIGGVAIAQFYGSHRANWATGTTAHTCLSTAPAAPGRGRNAICFCGTA